MSQTIHIVPPPPPTEIPGESKSSFYRRYVIEICKHFAKNNISGYEANNIINKYEKLASELNLQDISEDLSLIPEGPRASDYIKRCLENKNDVDDVDEKFVKHVTDLLISKTNVSIMTFQERSILKKFKVSYNIDDHINRYYGSGYSGYFSNTVKNECSLKIENFVTEYYVNLGWKVIVEYNLGTVTFYLDPQYFCETSSVSVRVPGQESSWSCSIS
jgi:hypothetical protein